MIHLPNIVQEKISRLDKKPNKKNIGSSSFEVSPEEEVSESHEVRSPRMVNNSLWMFQEIDGYAEEQIKMKETGNMLLKELGDIRLGLINGELGESDIKKLKDSLDQSNLSLKFPALQQVVEDIRLRVEVELAKLESL